MEKIIVWYLRMSLIYLLLGTVLGVVMLIAPETAPYRSIHAHLNLLGFMAMMIYGVGYHILPRFSGRMIYSNTIVRVQFWLANIGLWGMVFFWPVVINGAGGIPSAMLSISGVLESLAILLFVYNIMKTIKAA